MKAFLASLLQEVDPTAAIVDLTMDPDSLGYTVRLRTRGETGKPRSLSAGLLALARNGNPVAIRTIRVLLSTMLLETRSRQALDSARLTWHERWRPPPKPEMP